MKSLFVMAVATLFFTLIALTSEAAVLNLNDGESAVIRANVDTTVNCGGTTGGTNCQTRANNYASRMATCMTSNATNYCLNQLWPAFKSSYPNCLDEGSLICMDYCKRSNSVNWCMNFCQ